MIVAIFAAAAADSADFTTIACLCGMRTIEMETKDARAHKIRGAADAAAVLPHRTIPRLIFSLFA